SRNRPADYVQPQRIDILAHEVLFVDYDHNKNGDNRQYQTVQGLGKQKYLERFETKRRCNDTEADDQCKHDFILRIVKTALPSHETAHSDSRTHGRGCSR